MVVASYAQGVQLPPLEVMLANIIGSAVGFGESVKGSILSILAQC